MDFFCPGCSSWFYNLPCKKNIEYKENISFLNDYTLESYVIAKNGNPLKKWEKNLPTDYSIIDNELFRYDCNILDELEKIKAIYRENCDDHNILYKICIIYFEIGKFELCIQLITDLFKNDFDYFRNMRFIWLLGESYCAIGDKKKALKLLSTKFFPNGLSTIDSLRQQAIFSVIAGDFDKILPDLEKYAFSRTYNLMHLYFQRIIIKQIALYLDSIGETKKAINILDMFYETSRFKNETNAFIGIFCDAAALSMRLQNWENSEYRLRKIIYDLKIEHTTTLIFWLAGAIEQQGRAYEAVKLLEDEYENISLSQYGMAQLGMMYIRNKIKNPRYSHLIVEGNKYIEEMSHQVKHYFYGDWYKLKYKNIISDDCSNYMEHFLHYWRVLGIDPNPYFNTVYYRISNNDIFNNGADILLYFMTSNLHLLRNPSFNFSMASYKGKNNTIDWSVNNPLKHKLCMIKEETLQ